MKNNAFKGTISPELTINQLFLNKNIKSRKKTFSAGEIIIKQGTPSKGIFCVLSGEVWIYKEKGRSNELVLLQAKKGEILVIDSFCNRRKNTTSAIAVSNCEVCFVPDRVLRSVLTKSKEATTEFMKSLCRQVSLMEDQLTRLATKKCIERIAEILLLRLKAQKSISIIDNHIPLGADELAKMTGTSKEYCYKLLNKIAKAGHIKLTQRKIKIINAEGLNDMFFEATPV